MSNTELAVLAIGVVIIVAIVGGIIAKDIDEQREIEHRHERASHGNAGS